MHAVVGTIFDEKEATKALREQVGPRVSADPASPPATGLAERAATACR